MSNFLDAFSSLVLLDNEYAILPLGQHSFAVRTSNKTIWLDPFLTELEGREIPPLCKPCDITKADIVTGSHDHADHIDRDSLTELAGAAGDAVFVFPAAVTVEQVSENRTLHINDLQTLEINGVKITAVAAAHEFLETDENGNYYALGYIIECDGIKFYHSGDCCIYEGLLTKLKHYAPFDFAFLPINGRDAVRYNAGCIGNMTYQEAVDLAGSLDIELTVPAHFDMFALIRSCLLTIFMLNIQTENVLFPFPEPLSKVK